MEVLIIIIAAIVVIAIIASASSQAVNERVQEQLTERKDEFGIETEALAKQYLETSIPTVHGANIKLQRGEILHAVIPNVDWREARVVRTGNVSGVGVTGRIKLAKGIYLRGELEI